MNGLAGGALASLVLAPLVGAVAAFAAPRVSKWVGLAAAGLTMLATFLVVYWVAGFGVLSHRVGGWGAPLGIDLRVDGVAALMLLLTAGVGLAVSVHATGYFAPGDDETEARKERFFWPLYLFLWAALNALFVSADIFNLYVTLELLGFAAVSLVALAGGRESVTAAMRYLLASVSGSMFFLLGVALTYGVYGTVDLALLAARVEPGVVSSVALVLMTGGLMVKAALFPMHFWLPPAHANAPAPVSALLSALVVKGAIYILLRLWFEAFQPLATPLAMQTLGVLGAGAVLWGSVQALFQQRLKLLVAYSTVAQVGYLFLIFPLASGVEAGFTAWSGGLLLLTAHACAKSAMFLAAGNVIHAAGHDRIPELKGVAETLPVSVFAFGLAAVSLIGLPPSAGFFGKWLLLKAGFAQGQWWWVGVLLVGTVLAVCYMPRFISQAFRKAAAERLVHKVPPVMEWTAFGFALLSVLLGLVAWVPVDLLRIGAPLTSLAAGGGEGL